MAFNRAHDFNVENFNAITYGTQGANPTDILLRARALEATDKSNTAVYAPKCKEGTRTKIIRDVIDWVKTPTGNILWFSGPAGGGKTCIMREVAARCQKAGLVTCTYFFSTRIGGDLTKEAPFVATIVSQLINTIPDLKPLVLQAISDNPAIFEESLDSQMMSLVINPFESKAFQSIPSPPTKVVITVDGLDECGDKGERRHLLDLLRMLVVRLSATVVVVLASRPESDIRSLFDQPQFESITKEILLHNYDGSKDVRHYYCDEFERIRKNHPMRVSIPENWPVEEILGTLIGHSSGYFIVPATIVKYVDNPHRNPVESLEQAMSNAATPTAAKPWADIDALYTLILHPVETDIPVMKRILHSIIAMTAISSDSSPCTSSFLNEFLELKPGTVESTVYDLHSVLSIPSIPLASSDPICFHHKSLEDYLLSRERSNDLYQSQHETYIDLAIACSHHLQKWAANPSQSTKEIDYSSRHWDDYISRGLADKGVRLPDSLLSFDPRIIWKHCFVFDRVFFDGGNVDVVGSAFHSNVCQEGSPCSLFCKLLEHMKACYRRARVDALAYSLLGYTPTDKVKFLPRFEVETGLYEHKPVTESLDEVVAQVAPATAWSLSNLVYRRIRMN